MPQPTQTLTDVVNTALALLGHKPIQNIETPGRSLEAYLQGVVTSTIRTVQADYVWQELVHVVSINRESAITPDGFHQYPLPTNLLRIVKLESEAQYTRRGNRLLSRSEGPLNLFYIRYDEDPGNWSEYLNEAIYTEMAARLAMPLTQKVSLAQEFAAKAQALRRLNPAKAERESSSARVKSRDHEYVSVLRGAAMSRDNRTRLR